jgi:hypothetical protein
MANENDQFSKKATEQSAKQVENARTLKEEYKELLGIRSKLNEYDREAINLADKVTQSAKANVVELGRTGTLDKEILKDKKLLLDLERERLLSSKNLAASQINDAEKLANANINRLAILSKLEETQQQLLASDEIQYSLGLKEVERLQDELAKQEQIADQILKQENLDVQRLALAIQSEDQQKKNLGLKEKESTVQDQINKKLGIAGNSLKFVSTVLGDASKGFKFDKVAQDMQNFTDEAVRSGKAVGRLQVLGVGVKSAFGNLKATLTDPTVLIGSMVKGWQDIDKANKEFRQLTGQNVGALEQMNLSLISGVDYIKSAVKLSKELGVNARAAFSKETLTEAAELTELMGLGAKETARLATLSKVTGTELKNTTKTLETNFKSFVQTNKTALNFGDVINDVGNASAALSISLGSNPAKIQEAAMEARKLGINLEQADKIAESLLNFEDSISNELEAELLTGKDLNLEKARLAALNNDIATLSKEIGKNEQINQAFSSGNRIQQNAIAKSLGMSREEMAKMIYQQKIQNGLSAEQAAKAADISLEEAKRQTAQEQITKAIEKFQQILGLILTPINYILSNSVALGLVFTTLAIATLPKIISGVKGMAGGLKDSISATKDLAKGFTGLFKKGGLQEAGGKIKGFFSGADKTKDLTEKAGDSIGKSADKTKNVKGDAGKGIKQFLKGLGDGLASIGKQFGDVVKGSIAIGIAGLALGGSFALALKMVEGVNPVQMIAFAGSLTALGLTMALLGKMGGQVIQGALAMSILAVSLIPAAYAFSLLEGVDVKSIIAFSIALPLLSLAAAGLGLVAPFIMAGAAAFAVLGASLIPFALALKLIDSTSLENFTKLLGVISAEKAAALFTLGAGFVALAAGLGVFALAVAAAGISSFFAGDGIITQIEKLASLSNPLQTTANALTQMAVALMGVSTALGKIDDKKLKSLNEFATTNTIGSAVGGIVSAITAPIQALGNAVGGGNEKNNEIAEMKSILQQILAKETHIYLDTTKVGTGFSMGTSKVQ